MHSIRAKIAAAQGQILDALIGCESQTAAMYEGFAVLFPDSSLLWSELAAEERQHAKVLEAMHAVLARGNLFQNIGRFEQAKMKALHDLLETVNRKVLTGKTTLAEAVAAAVKVERSFVESHFYKVVLSDAPEFTAMCKTLQAEEERHFARINDVFQNGARVQTDSPELA